MNAFEFNKIAGAILSALLVIFGSKVFLELSKQSAQHGKAMAGYELPEPEAEAAAPAVDAAAAKPATKYKDVAAMLAKADVGAGQKIFKKCKACHTTKKGGANRVGPNLWSIIGRKKAASASFKYSGALKSSGGDWTYIEMAKFIHQPKKFMPGTKMAFAGIKANADLANLIAYLRSLSDSPPALPK